MIKVLGVVVLGSILALQGCAALVGAGAGAGAVAYKEGTLEAKYAAPLEQTWNAALAAMRDMNLRVVETKKDATEAKIEAQQADGTKVSAALKPEGSNVTSAKIRVGLLGDEEAARAIDRRIHAKLGK